MPASTDIHSYTMLTYTQSILHKLLREPWVIGRPPSPDTAGTCIHVESRQLVIGKEPGYYLEHLRSSASLLNSLV